VGVTQGPGAHTYYRFGELTFYEDGGTVGAADRATFFIGSNTKVFTGILLAVATLARSSRISLETHVNDLLPEGVRLSERHGPILVWHLATHSAAFPDGPCGMHSFGNYPFSAMTSFLQTFVPPYAPGKRWYYSNQSFALLGIVVANALAEDERGMLRSDGAWPHGYKRYWHQVASHIATPLGMESTGVDYRASASKVVAGFTLTNRNALVPVAPPQYALESAGLPAGAISSSASDLLTFLDAHMGYGKDARALKAIGLALRPVPPRNSLDMGLGWQIAGSGPADRYYQKDGGIPGYTSYMAVDSKRRWGIVVLSNTAGNNVGNAIALAGRKTLGALRGRATPVSYFPPPPSTPVCP
jgi:CubicO group peptidase (beta-lactamase class C family)